MNSIVRLRKWAANSTSKANHLEGRHRPAVSVRRKAIRRLILSGLALSASALAIVEAGCNRAYYRRTADEETYQLMDEKLAASGEIRAPYRLPVDRASRMFDPFNPDRPPMPEDDPASHRYMEFVDGKKGYPLWHVNGTTNTSESPDWWTFLPLDERGVLKLDSDLAVRVALVNSPVYQQNLETLYLSAIDVSSERFLLDTQFFATFGANYTVDGAYTSRGRKPDGSFGSNLQAGSFINPLASGSTGRRAMSIQRKFATGADMVIGMANSLTWQLSGPDTQTANTLLDFTLLQPLLRGAGRDVVLERLTLAERTLLANVRAMEQYRRGFYLQVTTGRNPDQGPSRRGGLFGGSGLEGFTGLGGGFGRVGGTGGGGGGAGFAAGSGVPNAGGFIGLLQNQLQIRNQEENVARLRDNLFRLEDSLRELLTTIPPTQETIPRQQLQVSQAQQALFSGQSNLITAKAQYEQQLDQFKITLGLPPYLCVEISDPMLDQFNLISAELKARRNSVAAIRDSVGKVNFELLGMSKEEQDATTQEGFRSITRTPEVNDALARLRMQLAPLRTIQSQLADRDIPEIRGDLDRLNTSIGKRAQQLNRLKQLYEADREMICQLLPTPTLDEQLFSSAAIEQLPQQLATDLTRLTDNIARYLVQIDQLDRELATLAQEQAGVRTPREDFARIRDAAILKSQELIAGLAEDVLSLQLIQARARTESIVLPDIELDPRQAVEIARQNRRDWMSARASLVNSWRAIELVADDLESAMNVVFSGDLQNRTDNPFSLRSTTGRLRVGVQWDTPITRLQERNRFRQSLIEYQQARRSYYQFEDGIWFLMRNILRSVRANQYNFELQRYAVRIAAQQINLNEDLRQIGEALNLASGPTAARDTVSALTDLLNAQNFFLGLWCNYEVLRRTLDQELGTMQLDAEGLWIDPGTISVDTLGGALNPGVQQMYLLDELPPETEFRVDPEIQPMGPPSEVPSIETLPGPSSSIMPNGNSIEVARRETGSNSVQTAASYGSLPTENFTVQSVSVAPASGSPNASVNGAGGIIEPAARPGFTQPSTPTTKPQVGEPRGFWINR